VKRILKEEEGVNFFVTSSSNVAGRLKQLNMNTQTQSVCVGVDAQLLYSVIHKCIVRGGVKPCEVVVDSGRSATTTSLDVEGGFLFHVLLTPA